MDKSVDISKGSQARREMLLIHMGNVKECGLVRLTSSGKKDLAGTHGPQKVLQAHGDGREHEMQGRCEGSA